MSLEAARNAVAKGVKWLEKTHGNDWRNLIDWNTFNIEDGFYCPLGQIYGSYSDAVYRCINCETAIEYGFDEYCDAEKEYNNYYYSELQTVWEETAGMPPKRALYDPSGSKVNPGDRIVTKFGNVHVYRGLSYELGKPEVNVENEDVSVTAHHLGYYSILGYTVH